MKKSESIKKRKKRMLIATLGIAALIVGGLTFAWFTSQQTVTNTFKTSGNFKTTVVENFTPPTNWQPGTTTDKIVQVTNTGTIDAYTRIEFVPTLTFYSVVKDEETQQPKTVTVTDSFVSPDSGNSYIPASTAAIDSVGENGDWVKLTSDNYEAKLVDKLAPLKGYLTVPKGVTVWVKASEGRSVTSDEVVVEDGYNYEFMGYVTDPSDSTKAYAIEVTKATYKSTPESDTGSVAHSVNNNLEIKVTSTKEKTYRYTDKEGRNFIDSMIEYEFDDLTNWAERIVPDDTADLKTKYYYYKPILKSGATTTPLLKAVKFKDTFESEIYDAKLDLNVEMVSTQAIYEAANDTFKNAASGVKSDEDALKDSNFNAASITLEKNTSIDTEGNKVTSSTTTGTDDEKKDDNSSAQGDTDPDNTSN
jgi:predicted ribosomally synthesized peptide with SipW-like signal peptide